MKFYIYSVFDPEVDSFDSRLTLSPVEPKEMGEQYRRTHIKMNKVDKDFMEGKVGVCLGLFDDETGKITQSKMLEIYKFKQEVKGQEETGEKEDGKNV